MYATSARWDDALRTSGLVVARCEVWRSGSPVLDADGNVVTLDLAPSSSVRVDESSNVRRVLTASMGRSDLMPSAAEDLLAPIDTDLRVWCGVQYTEGDTETVPVFTGRLVQPERPSIRSHEVRLDARDYSYVIAAARFERPWNIGAGDLVTDAITELVLDVLPWVEVVDLTGSTRRTRPATFERERWQAVTTLADSIGADVGFDPEGRLIIRPVPTIATVPDWTIDYGHGAAVMTDLGVGMSVEGLYNAVTATSSDSEQVVSATVYQRSGPFAWRAGFKRPRFYASPMLRTVGDCQSAATAILARSLALSQPLEPTSAPNPALEVGDTVAVLVPSPTGPDLASRLVAGFTLPLGPGSMPLTVRTETDPTTEEGLS
jgi:hypothetical protein